MTGAALLAAALLLLSSTSFSHAQLQVGFYTGKCKGTDVESIIRGVVQARFAKDPSILPALLRMQFHDCFVRGCDASILLDVSGSEKNAGANQSVRGYELIDDIKAAVEKACPNLVSCADIIVAATRDAVVSGGGKRYEVETGRRDGKISRASDVKLPGPSISVSNAISLFKSKNLTADEMVLLLGGHTVGVTHCSFIMSRLYNFNGSGKPDPSMQPSLVASLQRTCPQSSSVDSPVNLDQNATSGNVVDNSFYKQILQNRGVLQIDQALALDTTTRPAVSSLAGGQRDFGVQFGRAMVRLGAVDVITGRKGEVRKKCRAVNKKSAEEAAFDIIEPFEFDQEPLQQRVSTM